MKKTKYIVSESEFNVLLKEDRIEYLKRNNVITPEELPTDDQFGRKTGKINIDQSQGQITPIKDHAGIDIAYIISSKKGKSNIKLTEEQFQQIVDADPTVNKQYVDWMIKVFFKHIKENDLPQAVRFVTEDLPEATEFLTVFDRVKNTKLFKRSAGNRPNAPENVTDIKQYDSLSQLYSVISPFIGMSDDDETEEGESRLWNAMKRFIDLGEAKLAYRDNDVLIYMPLTNESSCGPLENLASWCTRRPGNSHFDSYRRDNPRPDGSLSNYYVIIPRELFDGIGSDTYPLQFHFESQQLHDKENRSIEPGRGNGKLTDILSKYPGLTKFLLKELKSLAEQDIRMGTGLIDSKYLKYVTMLGGKVSDIISPEIYEEGVENIKKLASEQRVPLNDNKYIQWLLVNVGDINIVDYLDPNITSGTLNFSGLNIGEIPDISKFNKVNKVVAIGCGLTKLPDYSKLPSNLLTLALKNNQIKVFPIKGYENLKVLFVVNLEDNPLTTINVDILKNMTELSKIMYNSNISNQQEVTDYFKGLTS
jgi:hypothetical protein